jgi:hypothetical protein
MSCTNKFNAVPPFIAKQPEAKTLGVMASSSRTVSM